MQIGIRCNLCLKMSPCRKFNILTFHKQSSNKTYYSSNCHSSTITSCLFHCTILKWYSNIIYCIYRIYSKFQFS